MNILAVIPARGGSKGIKYKNLMHINGRSLLERSILTAMGTRNKMTVVVSTDSNIIKEESEKLGAIVMRTRPVELSTDLADAHKVWQEEVRYAEKIQNCNYNMSVYLEPTCPLRTSDDIDICIDILKSNISYNAVATISELHGNQHPLKLHSMTNHDLRYYSKDGINHHNRQSIKHQLYWRNGACYASRVPNLLKKQKIFESECAAVLIERPMVNIDSEQDARIAAAIELCMVDKSWGDLIKIKDI